MTTRRKQSQATGREGINFVRSLVERNNSTFQEIDLHNDLGNDAYVEFVVKESATGCCVALQIKSGQSYRSEAGRFVMQADRDHFEYWSSHTLPVLAVIVDPVANEAAWVDITDYLRANPDVIAAGPYALYAKTPFSDATFPSFREHCLRYRDQYSREPNFGRALESFAARQDHERCYDGLRALFAFHRNQGATWYFMASCLSNFRGHPLLRPLVGCLCHIPGHPDIFWGKTNIIDDAVRAAARAFMHERFDRRDALTLLSVVDDAGIDRGSIGQCVHALIDTMADVPSMMESIATDSTMGERVRHCALLFAANSMQYASPDDALQLLDRVRPSVEGTDLIEVLQWLEEEIRHYGYIALY